MAGQYSFGKDFVILPQASGVHISMENAQMVTFSGYEDGGATDVVMTQSIDATGTATLATTTTFYTSTGIGGAWTTNTMTAGGTIEPGDTAAEDGWSFTILASDLSDGYNYVECTPDAGTCFAVIHGLNYGRVADNIGITGIAEVS